ncbi:hypothetical protein GCM10029992_18290 [Glycomyces albus]
MKRDRSPLGDGLALLVCGVLAGILTAAAAFPLFATGGIFAGDSIEAFESLPTELTQSALPQTSYVYASDGETLITSFYEENRREVSIDDVDPVMIDALLAAEDSKFYEHNGVDWAGIARAALANQSGGDSQGASTLTMQFVRNTLIYSASTIDEVIEASEDTYDRKLREARFAMAVEDSMSKEEILQGYLNVIYLGNQAYGIHAGAYTYFNKPPSDLELHEAATLAALPKFPSYADGLLDGEGDDANIIERRNWVLGRMAELGTISESEADEAADQPLGFDPGPNATSASTSPRTPGASSATTSNRGGATKRRSARPSATASACSSAAASASSPASTPTSRTRPPRRSRTASTTTTSARSDR